MKIELTHIKVRDLVDEFSDSEENGVTGENIYKRSLIKRKGVV